MGLTMRWARAVVVAVVVIAAGCVGEISFNNGGYEGIVVTIGEHVPVTHCRDILDNLESALKNASQFLYTSLDGRAYLSSVTVLLPDAWPNNCTARPVTGHAGITVDVKIGVNHPVFGDLPWTQQSGGCGEQGDFIAISHKQLDGRSTLSGMLVQEWAKYRYGVFDESGHRGDSVYPICYQAEASEHLVTGCSDKPIEDLGVCSGENESASNSQLVHPDASTSLMFASGAPQVGKFCNATTHDRYAPTKHNFMCGRRSIMEVILQHRDFQGNSYVAPTSPLDTTPIVSYKRRAPARFVLVIEDTQAMATRDSWTHLRAAVRKLAVLDLPAHTEMALVLANDTAATTVQRLAALKTTASRDLVAANLPYTPGDAHTAACVHCALTQAVQMLEERAASNGPATSVVIVISAGHTPSPAVDAATSRAARAGIHVSTVNYPDLLRHAPLDAVARATGGLAFTVREQRYNMATSYLTTYFQLANALFSIAARFCDSRGMPIEIHRRELWEEGRSVVTGSFVLEESLGEPARFTVFTASVENPLIRGMTLVSPSQVVYATRSDSLLSMKMLTLNAHINETGTWTYTIDRFPGNPQPHFVQVVASPRSRYAGVVRARAWLSEAGALRVAVTKGDHPVLGARVEVAAVGGSGGGGNGTAVARDRFELLDTGSGDPDVTKGDGVYSRHFSPKSGPGVYTFDIKVSDNSNTAYSYQDQITSSFLDSPSPPPSAPCCGSTLPSPAVRPTSPFVRILPPLSATIAASQLATTTLHPGRIGNLRVDILAEQLRARLVFTAPDPAAKRYEVRYAKTLREIVDSPRNAILWEHGTPFPLSPGSESTFTLDFTRNPSLLDKPLYFCVEPFGSEESLNDLARDDEDLAPRTSSCSNWVRVLVPSPPPPPALATDYPGYGGDDSSWIPHAVIPSIAGAGDYGWELILPVAGGVVLLALCVAVYCYMCVLRRKGDKKKKEKKGASAQPTIQIVPSSPSPASVVPQHFEACLGAEDEKKRGSVAPLHYEEKLVDDPIATITPLRQRTLSPYQSWTASQLLHEHERRHSPYGEVSHNPNLTYERDPNLTYDSNHAYDVQHGQYNAPASLYGDNQSVQHYYVEQAMRNQYNNEINNPPPVPPLPSLNNTMNGIYTSGPIYGVQPGTFAANGYHRNGSLMQFNPSVQGSLSSVSSGDKKKRNVTMV